MANRKITQFPAINPNDIVDDDLVSLVSVFEIDPALRNKKLNFSGLRVYLDQYYINQGETDPFTVGNVLVTGTTITGTSGTFNTIVSAPTISGTDGFFDVLVVSGQAEFPWGTQTAPGITFTGDLNTGFYNPSGEMIAATVNGKRGWTIESGTGNSEGRHVLTIWNI